MKYILAMLLLFSIGASAQIQVDSLIVKQKFKLNGYRLTGVSNDTTTANQDSGKVMTEGAIKRMVLGRAASRDVQIAAKVNYTDTSMMFLAYQIAINGRLKYYDTAAFLTAYQTAINYRIKYSDSSAMLAAYQTSINLRMKYSDSASFLAAYRTALNARMRYTDSVVMLAAYQSAINARIKYSDSSAMLSAYQSALNTRLRYTDSVTMLAAYQTALNVRMKYSDSSLMLMAYQNALNNRQTTLVSGTNIKTLNGSSILGSGNLTISAGVTGSGFPLGQLMPLTLWSGANSSLSSSSVNYGNYDSINHNFNLGTAISQSNYLLNVNGNAKVNSLQLGIFNNSSINVTGTPNTIHLGNELSNNAGYNLKLIIGQGTYAGSYPYYAGLGISSNGNNLDYVSQTQHVWYTNGTSPSSIMTLNPSGNLTASGQISSNNGVNGTVVVGNYTGTLYITNPSYGYSLSVLGGGTLNLTTGGNLGFVQGSTTYGKLFNTGKWGFGASPTDDGINLIQVSGSVKAFAFNATATQTTLSGATSGTAIFSQPNQGSSQKKIIIYCNALMGATVSYTFPTAYTYTPAIIATNGLASSVVTTLTTTGVVLTGAASTGFLILEGY